jgi:hypothetical protein
MLVYQRVFYLSGGEMVMIDVPKKMSHKRCPEKDVPKKMSTSESPDIVC